MERMRKGFEALTHDDLVILAAFLEQASLKTLVGIVGKQTLGKAVVGINRLSHFTATGLEKVGVKTPDWTHSPLRYVDAPSLQEDFER